MSKRTEQQANHRDLAAFRYEIRRFLNFSDRAAREAGVEPHQHQALLAIKGLVPGVQATVGVLAERLQVQHHSACELSDRLQEKGLIRRWRSETDRREVLLELTRRGERVLEQLSAAHRIELRVAGPKLMKALQAVVSHNGRSGVSDTVSSPRRRGNRKVGKVRREVRTRMRKRIS
ncbi:MAG TPA: MarR family transcriptional regulator [Candidatus Acidoferrales bacterium]|nr:MarR family transcriptional regulator [Candidatus Acidoferrales bacterium]